MSTDLDALVKLLRAEHGRGGEWIVTETRCFRLGRELGSNVATHESLDHRFVVTLFRDSRQGRGSATVSLDPATDLSPSSLRAARDRAAANQGPLWRLPRPAAPARVELVDRRLVDDPEGEIGELAGVLGDADTRARIPRASIDIAKTDVRVLTSSELDMGYSATEIAVDALIVTGARRLRLATPLQLRARRLADIDLAASLASTAASLADEANADPVEPGVYDVVIDTAALERRAAGGFGWLAPLVTQASGALARRALSRYQPGQSIYGDAEVTGDRLSLASDGAIDYGWRSAPFAERGEAIRRFALVDAGVAAGLALDAREAALRDALPNGGVRNLVVGVGERPMAALPTGGRPALIARDVSWLEVDPRSGDLAIELRLSRLAGVSGGLVRGGQLSGNLFDWLPRLRLGADRLATPAYRGPRWIAIPSVRVF